VLGAPSVSEARQSCRVGGAGAWVEEICRWLTAQDIDAAQADLAERGGCDQQVSARARLVKERRYAYNRVQKGAAGKKAMTPARGACGEARRCTDGRAPHGAVAVAGRLPALRLPARGLCR
jgi:hypothetical protein